MTHLGFIAASYGIAVVVVLVLSADAWRRLSQAKRRLAVLDAASPRRRAAKA
ncbi:heme exporter protein CcmD [Acidisoma cladoniae]|uniref:heme exporter protein CcmD n=1 Tax=Acidisoma cladoniae TaxID=3040935 RepID=UPI002551B477|nr:heme exporter protein CcmD [Acidisoma sp. PAMC 29798]